MRPQVPVDKSRYGDHLGYVLVFFAMNGITGWLDYARLRVRLWEVSDVRAMCVRGLMFRSCSESEGQEAWFGLWFEALIGHSQDSPRTVLLSRVLKSTLRSTTRWV